jgi:hypothetical protein
MDKTHKYILPTFSLREVNIYIPILTEVDLFSIIMDMSLHIHIDGYTNSPCLLLTL